MDYYLTRDAESLVRQWCKELEFIPPHPKVFKRCFARLKGSLQQCFDREMELGKVKANRKGSSRVIVKEIPFNRMQHCIAKRHILERNQYKSCFWISLDCVYTREEGWNKDADFRIQVTRVFEPDGCKKLGLAARPSVPYTPLDTLYEPLDVQIRKCAEKYEEVTSGGNEIADVYVADDGIYSGGSIIKVIQLLAKNKVVPTAVVSGLATSEGHDELKKALKRLSSRYGFEVPKYRFGFVQEKKQIHDWVCERDFFLGVPHGGRTIGHLGKRGAIKVVRRDAQSGGIFYAVGSTNDLRDCANIGLGAFSLTGVVLNNSYELWRAIEQDNRTLLKDKYGRDTIPVSLIPRVPFPLTFQESNASFTGWLRQGLEWLGMRPDADL